MLSKEKQNFFFFNIHCTLKKGLIRLIVKNLKKEEVCFKKNIKTETVKYTELY